jgi:hypothetical protein
LEKSLACWEAPVFDNPFVPVFGGKPDFFFGRTSILDRFARALKDRGSEDRALFVTGNRGCGKTALLEQLSQTAAAAGWRTIDLNSEKALVGFTRGLVRHDSVTKSVAPEVEVNVLGSGGRIAGFSTANATSYGVDDLEVLFLEACAAAPQGVFVSVDEIQKIAPEDLSVICGAFQMASRKGHDIILAVAGLPYAYDEVIHYEGCTYMRRAAHECLGVFAPDEARRAFVEAFGRVRGLSVDPEALDRLAGVSMGHPYLIQLAGYYLVLHVNEGLPGKTHTVTRPEVDEVVPTIFDAYERRALRPVVDELPRSQRDYLAAMARVIGPDRTVLTRDVAAALGKPAKSTSAARDGLLRQGLVVGAGRGVLMFNVPYLQHYMLKGDPEPTEATLAQQWGF